MKNFIIYLFFILVSTAFICCTDEQLEDDGNLNEDNADYIQIRSKENDRVWQLMRQYAKGGEKKSLNDDSSAYDRLNIAFMTDSHIDLGPRPKESRRNVKDAIDFCNMSEVPISAIIHGGDLITDAQSKKEEHIIRLNRFFELGWNAHMPLLYTKGNHDLNAFEFSQIMTDKDWGEVWFDKAEKDYGIVRNLKSNGQKSSYYYYDLNDWKVRIICIDCFDVDYSKKDANGNILYYGGSSYYVANEQFNWIVNIALNFDDKKDKDWGVIVFTHYYYPYNNPNNTKGTDIEPIFDDVYSKLNKMLISFNRCSIYSESYLFPPNSFYNLSIKGDWTRYANLERKPFLICVLSGHQHTDLMTNWWGAIHVMTANQFCGKEYSDERIERVPGTKTQNLFDILNIDLKERRLRIIRYGASANLDGNEGNRCLPNGHGF